MQCQTCQRNDPYLRFYCQSCVDTRIVEHESRRHALSSTLARVRQKTLALLPLVSEERELKARKFALATRLRDARAAVAVAKSALAEGRKDVEVRTVTIAERKARLTRAIALLDSAKTKDHLGLLELQDGAVWKEKQQQLAVFSAELAAIFSVSSSNPVSSVVTSPFSASPISTLPSPSRTFFLSRPLPRLDSPMPPTQESHFILTNLLFLLRLLALYHSLPLPFLPVVTSFASLPGVAGLLPSPLFPSLSSSDPKGQGYRITPPLTESGKESKWKRRELKTAYIAITYDFAWLLWNILAGEESLSAEDLSDAGAIILRVLRLRIKSRSRELRSFPLEWTDVLDRFLPNSISRPPRKSQSHKHRSSDDGDEATKLQVLEWEWDDEDNDVSFIVAPEVSRTGRISRTGRSESEEDWDLL